MSKPVAFLLGLNGPVWTILVPTAIYTAVTH